MTVFKLDDKVKTLFFDLDNTLVSKSYKGHASDICFPTFTENGMCLQVKNKKI